MAGQSNGNAIFFLQLMNIPHQAPLPGQPHFVHHIRFVYDLYPSGLLPVIHIQHSCPSVTLDAHVAAIPEYRFQAVTFRIRLCQGNKMIRRKRD